MTAPVRSGAAGAAFLQELVRLRTQAGLTTKDLAERLGVNESLVTRGETGSRRIGVVELRLWAVACGVSLEEFGRRLEARTLQ
jgi:transcriptional regulator with XRE-family HTH domain